MASAKEAKEVLKRFYIETPSWAYGNSGTRFKVFAQPGVPRDPYEKISDAAQVHKYTGAAPAVAMHIPWDKVDDYAKLAKHAKDNGVYLGTINSNTFQDDDYKFGSVCHFDMIALAITRECCWSISFSNQLSTQPMCRTGVPLTCTA